MQIKWLRKALKNLEQAYNYLSEQETPETASALILKIQKAAEQLSNYPMMGYLGRIEGTRELVIPQSHYIIIYRLKGESVEILRVLHASRRYP